MLAGCPTLIRLTVGDSLRKVEYMKATFDIDERVMRRLQEVATRKETTVSALVEAAIKDILGVGFPPESSLRPLPTWPMGKALVDISNREELFDKLEDWDKFRQLYGDPPKE